MDESFPFEHNIYRSDKKSLKSFCMIFHETCFYVYTNIPSGISNLKGFVFLKHCILPWLIICIDFRVNVEMVLSYGNFIKLNLISYKVYWILYGNLCSQHLVECIVKHDLMHLCSVTGTVMVLPKKAVRVTNGLGYCDICNL